MQFATSAKKLETKLIMQGILLTVIGCILRYFGIRFGQYIASCAGADVVGIGSLASGAVGFAVTLCCAGVGLGCTQLVSVGIGKNDCRQIQLTLSVSLRYALFCGIFIAVLLFLSADWIALRILQDSRCAPSLRLRALTLPFISLGSALAGYFASLKYTPAAGVIRTLGECVRVLCVSVGFRVCSPLTKGDVRTPLIILSIADIFAEGFVFLLLIGLLGWVQKRNPSFCTYATGRQKKQLRRSIRRQYFAIVLPLSLSACFRSALLNIEHLLIPDALVRFGLTREQGLAAFGLLHSLVFPLILLPGAAVASFGNLLIPDVTELCTCGEDTRVKRHCFRSFQTVLTYSIGIAIAFFFFADAIGTSYFHSADAVRSIRILAPLIPIMYADMITDALLKGFGEHLYSMKVNILDALLSLLIVVLFLKKYGMDGYIYGVYFTELFNFVLSFRRLSRHIRIPIRPLRTCLLPIACGILFAGIVKQAVHPQNSAAMIGAFILYSAAYAGSILLLNAMQKTVNVKEAVKKRKVI